MALNGLPHSEYDVINRSLILGTGPKGIIGLSGPTEMGPINKPTLIGSWDEYTRTFGGYLPDDDFPLLCRRILDRGGRIRVNRLGHYTTISDASTLTGTKATGTMGAGGNTAVFTAKNIGAWGNGVVVTATAAASGIAGMLDISFAHPANANMNYTVRNVKATGLTAADKTAFNNESPYIDIGATAGTLAAGTVTLSTGAYTVSAIVAVDYIGDPTSNTGWYAFGQAKDIVKLCAPSKADRAIDAGLAVYVNSRPDIIGVVRTPVGATDALAVDYREGTGTYAPGTPIDNWRMIMTTGGLTINHPATGVVQNITEVTDVLGGLSVRDNSDLDEYKAGFGSKRGRVTNVLDVVYNVGTASRKANADNLVFHGINPVINHEAFGPVYFGNRTLTKQYVGTLLERANVAEFLVSLYRNVKPLVDGELGDPNDLITWKTVYRKVRDLMLTLEQKRAVYPGEGKGWVFQGDQNVDDIAQAVVNTSNTIAAGQYVFYLFVKPIGALEFVGIRVVVDNTSVNYEVTLAQPNL